MINPQQDETHQVSGYFRYPGPSSFGDDQISESTFFGRTTEVLQLADRIAAERLTVLFGKSGIGKTSLLNAGLFPRLRALGFAPIVLRPKEISRSWDDEVRQAIEGMAASQKLKVSMPVKDKDGIDIDNFFSETLITCDDEFLIPVVVIDQFEEIFRVDDEIKRQFAVLMESLVGPGHRLRSNIPDLRIVLSLREEFVGALDEFGQIMPGIFANRYRLAPLNQEGAKEAIMKPASLQDDHFKSPSFEYLPEFIEDLLGYLGYKDAFEPIQLQVICRYIEYEVIRRDQQKNSYSPITHTTYFEDISSGFKLILEQFYDDTIYQLGSEISRKRAKELCEYGLVAPGGYRDSIPEEKIIGDYKLTSEELDRLVDARLIRREDRLNDLWYEITHDRLAEAIASKRSFRVPKLFWMYLVAVLVSLSGVFFAFVVESKRSSDLLLQQEISQQTLQELESRSAFIEAKNQEINALKLRLRNASQAMTAELIQRGGLKIPKMVTIKPGVFEMGEDSASPFSAPQHKVEIINPFKVSQYEVTFSQYDQFATDVGISLPSDNGWGRDNRPVINISWVNARAYTQWLTEKVQADDPSTPSFRLLSEAEWEYVARSGTSHKYGFGDDRAELCQHANHADIQLNLHWSSDKCSDTTGYSTAVVGTYRKNSFGVNDMLGNVSEWIADCWSDNYSAKLDTDSVSESANNQCHRRVIRGGSWFDSYDVLTVGNRDWHFQQLGNETIGFRIAQDIK